MISYEGTVHFATVLLFYPKILSLTDRDKKNLHFQQKK